MPARLAFKKDTNDSRESAAIHVCRDLLRERAKLHIYDPRVDETQIRNDLVQIMADDSGYIRPADQQLIDQHVVVSTDCYAAANQAHAIAVLTEWDEFKAIDLALERLQPGDLCLILIDQVEEALEHIAKRVAGA